MKNKTNDISDIFEVVYFKNNQMKQNKIWYILKCLSVIISVIIIISLIK